MKYVFYDIECANCYQGKGKICSFGYVITDEEFHILEQHDMVMNPASKFNLGPDIKLAYSKSEFTSSPLFPVFYDEIDALLTDPDCLVFGFSVNNDARYVRDECSRYHLPHLNYQFYDVQQMFMSYESVKNQPSLAKICEQYGVPESQEIHKSDEDAKMTMEVLVALCQATGKNVSELIVEYPRSVGASENGEVHWLHPPVKETSVSKVSSTASSTKKKNVMSLYSPSYRRFCRYVRSLKISNNPASPLNGRSVCLSSNYEERHAEQSKEIARLVAQNGGRYSFVSPECDLFVSYDRVKSDGTIKKCARLNKVNDAIQKGKSIEIVQLGDFLEMLGTSEEELDAALSKSDEPSPEENFLPLAANE